MFSWKKYFEYLTQNNKIKTGSFKVIKKITKCILKTKHTSKQGLSMKCGSGKLYFMQSQIKLLIFFRTNGSDFSRLCLFMEKGKQHSNQKFCNVQCYPGAGLRGSHGCLPTDGKSRAGSGGLHHSGVYRGQHSNSTGCFF